MHNVAFVFVFIVVHQISFFIIYFLANFHYSATSKAKCINHWTCVYNCFSLSCLLVKVGKHPYKVVVFLNNVMDQVTKTLFKNNSSYFDFEDEKYEKPKTSSFSYLIKCLFIHENHIHTLFEETNVNSWNHWICRQCHFLMELSKYSIIWTYI